MKHKIGEKTSHSYCSWTHGPRRTTHGTFGKRPWWWISSRRSILPPTGCREEVSWRSRSVERYGDGTMEKFTILDILEGFPIGEVNIGRRRAPEEVGPTQATWWRGQGVGRAGRPPGQALAPLWPIFVLREASVTLIFIYFSQDFWDSVNWGKSPCKKDISRQKQIGRAHV